MSKARQQKGVALVTALLVVTLATVASVAMVSRQQLDVRRSANLLQADQAYQYAVGMEQWAAHLLRRDAEKSTIDELGEDWAVALPPVPVDGGQITGYIEDLQGRFNLNNLVEGGAANPLQMERFRRLLETLELSPDLVEAVVDWLDEDIDVTLPSGAEDSEYLGRDPAYRAANRLMADPTELLLVAGFDFESYRRLAPFVTALPPGTAINLNTASAEVLTVLAHGVTLAEAEALVQARENAPFAATNDGLSHPVLAGREIDSTGLDVKTSYFLARAAVNIGRITVDYYSLLQRHPNGTSVVLLRGRGAYGA